MRILGSVAILLLAAQAFGQLSTTTTYVEGVPGEFVALSFVDVAGSVLNVATPPFFTMTGFPTVNDGRATVFLYVGLDAPAGDHEVLVHTEDGPPTTVTVHVRERTSIDVVAGDDVNAVQGEPVILTVHLHNAGNALAKVAVEIRSQLNLRQTHFVYDIEPGATEVVTFETVGGTRSGKDVAIVTATPTSDPDESRFVIIRTVVVPFAGAADLQGLSMAYRIAATETYGTSGWRTRVAGALDGDLSDHVSGSAQLTLDWPVGLEPTVMGAASLAGDDWAVRYRTVLGGHRIEGRYRDLQAYSYLTQDSFGVGAEYSTGDFFVAGSHTHTTSDTQMLSAGYRFSVTPEFLLTPEVSATRTTEGGERVTGGAAVTASLNTVPLLGVLRVETPVPLDDDWRVTAAVSSRTREPIGFRADASVTGRGVAGNLTVTESLGDEVSLHQRLAYDGAGRLSLGVRYSPHGEPLEMVASGTASYEEARFGVAYGLSAAYRPTPFSMNAYVRGELGGLASYGGSLGFHNGRYTGSVAYRASSNTNLASLSLGLNDTQYSATAKYGYDFARHAHLGSLQGTYDSYKGYTLFGSLAVGTSLRWQVGATISLTGGFATPDDVIDTFGGREGGVVSGEVFHDADRDGVRDPGELPVIGASVSFGDVTATTNELGGYQVVLPVGTYRPRVGGLTASLGQATEPPIEVTTDSNRVVDLAVQTVATAIVTVFDDANRNGSRDATEASLGGITVSLRSTTGTVTSERTDQSGEAIFQRLEPAMYAAYVNQTTLPDGYEPTNATVTINVASGSATRTELGVARRPPHIVQTLVRGDISIAVRVDPAQAPAGADVQVGVIVTGGDATRVTVLVADGEPKELGRQDDGTYRGRVTVPEDAVGVTMLSIVAEAPGQRVQRTVPLIINQAPLVSLSVTPAFAAPGENLRVVVTGLTRLENVALAYGDQTIPLDMGEDPYTFSGVLRAPRETGTYRVEVLADGKKVSDGRFRVE